MEIPRRSGGLLPNIIDKIRDINISVAKSALQCVSIYFLMKRKDDDATISMLHLNVTPFSMDFDEAKPFQGREDLPA